jgi:dipeptidyl aminopeptidase/acylaminoacyl peptidase
VTVHTRDGQTLTGTLTLPIAGARPLPAVYLITGAGMQDRDNAGPDSPFRPFRQIADTLSRRGLAVLRLDDRGVNGSTGSIDTMTTYERAIDTRAALAYLRTRSDIDSTRLALVGYSEGGLIAPIVAAEDRALRGIVLMATPGELGRKIIEWQRRTQIEEDVAIAPDKRDSAYAASMQRFDTQNPQDRWSRFFEAYDPTRVALRVRTPVLILHGSKDENIPPEDAQRLASAFRAGGNLRVTVQVFDGLMHSFLDESHFDDPSGAVTPAALELPDAVLGAISDWLVARLAP